MERLLIVGSDAFRVRAIRLARRFSTAIRLVRAVNPHGDVRTAAREIRPDVVVIDGMIEGETALARIRDARTEIPDALVLVVAGETASELTAPALEAGALVLLSAPSPAAPVVAPKGSLADAVAVPAGHALVASQLTSRELEILACVADGMTNLLIARKLWVTEGTVKFHLSNIYRKLGVSNRTEASRFALEHGLVGPLDAEQARKGDGNGRRARTASWRLRGDGASAA